MIASTLANQWFYATGISEKCKNSTWFRAQRMSDTTKPNTVFSGVKNKLFFFFGKHALH
ncbi:hypothetical protein MED121_20136 [Marinomonas sp. MED121]|nr:hypothetical protein MED121_20136 [Marinomonas sp. MED121]